MENKDFETMCRYKSAMAQARLMRHRNLITDAEYTIIESAMCEKYGVNPVCLYRDIDWFNTVFDAPVKEVV